jgi:hypothetical protein
MGESGWLPRGCLSDEGRPAKSCMLSSYKFGALSLRGTLCFTFRVVKVKAYHTLTVAQ